MSNSEVANIIIGVAVVVALAVRQMRVRPVREGSAARIVIVLGVIGVIVLVNAGKGHTVGTTTVMWVAGSLVLGGLLGFARGLTVKVWRAEDGSAWRKGTIATIVLWAVALGAHLAMEAGIDSSTRIVGYGASSVLLYLAVTLAAQREVLRWRASNLVRTSP